MKICTHFIAILMLFFFRVTIYSQTTIYTENFNNGCSSDCLANTYGGWTIQDNVGGTTGTAPNNWFVSCAEEGITPPDCGSTCIGDASLHIGANPGAGGDLGASFNETGATNATYKLAISPVISTVGFSTNTLTFDFIAFGSSSCSDDRAQLWLSWDGGVTWPAGFQYCLVSPCCGGACNGYSQGQWTEYNLALPAIFNNNPNVRIGFHWRNNGNGAGTDPSVAIDDIRLTNPILPLTLLDFAVRPDRDKAKLSWTTADESNVSHFEVERSYEAKDFKSIGRVDAKGEGVTGMNYYAFNDPQSITATAYYRLKMVDLDGTFTYSDIRSINGHQSLPSLTIQDVYIQQDILKYNLTATDYLTADVEVYDSAGKLVLSQQSKNIGKGTTPVTMNIAKLGNGVYLLNVRSLTQGKTVSATEKFVRIK